MNKNSPILLKISCLIFIIGFIFSVPTSKIVAETRGVDILANITPENPRPYEDVTITLESYATDLNRAMIEWKSGEKIFLKNTGVTDYSFKMGALGTQSLIDIKIITVDGDIVQKRIILTPTDMDILWQAVNSYVPPFYKGKALPPKEGKVRVIAIPSGQKGIQANNTAYNWKLNNATQQDQSGYKKNSFVFDLTNGTEDSIEVTSIPVSEGSNATGSFKISGVNPEILFYKKSINEGIYYNKTLGKEMYLDTDEITIVGEPYFMGDNQNTGSHIYEWKINGEDIQTPTKRNTLTVRPTSKGGYAKISLRIENTLKLFQSAVQNLTINL